jgi:hypothetical protein
VRRLLVALALASSSLVLTASPAAAHGVGGDASNYHSEVDGGVEPGLRWRVLGNDALLELRNDSGAEVIVLGYEGEPYLRFDGDGVSENRRSPAAYLNVERFATVEVPDDADAAAPPRWQRVADGTTYRWHDHRIHWMSSSPPAAIRGDLGQRHVIERWKIAHRIDGRPATLEGTLRWTPSDSWWPWYLGVGAVTGAVVLLGLRSKPRGGRWPALARPVAALVLVATFGAVVHSLDDVTSVPGSSGDASELVGVGLLALLGALTAWRGWRGDQVGFVSLALGGVVLAYLQGVTDSTMFSLPELVSGLPVFVTRLAVATAMAAGASALAALLLTHRHLAAEKFGRPGSVTHPGAESATK